MLRFVLLPVSSIQVAVASTPAGAYLVLRDGGGLWCASAIDADGERALGAFATFVAAARACREAERTVRALPIASED